MLKTDESLNALLDISKEINSIRDLESLMEKILDIALNYLEAERGFVLMRQNAEDSLIPVAAQNIDPGKKSELSEISSSTVQKVIEQSKAILAFDTQDNDQFETKQSVILQKIASIACVPLMLKGSLLGVIYIDSRIKTAGFNQQSLNFLEAFANQAAIAIENVRLNEELQKENELLKGEFHRIYAFKEIIGSSDEMKYVFEMIGRVLNNDVTVLLTGETGTGKEVVARAIHQNGKRKAKPFVAINCAVIPDNLIESELFGHKKGSFTGAIADKKGLVEKAAGGTLLLDEIGDLNPNVQVKLLRFLQERTFNPVGGTTDKEVDVRIITATNRKLEEEVAKGTFRDDLFYRLNVVNINLPPLREREKDIPLLTEHFLKKYAHRNNAAQKKISPLAMEELVKYNWPGNVRELENALERAIVFSGEDIINAEHIVLKKPKGDLKIQAGMTLNKVSAILLKQTLKACKGNKTKAAQMMGVSLRWVHYQHKNNKDS